MSEPTIHPDDNDQWACYEKSSRSRTGEPTRIIRPVTEPQPKYFTYAGPATPEEIRAEKKKRAADAKEARVLAEFRARPEYQDAQAIRNALEWMTPTDNRLDCLTPAEWAKLRKKLC
jgi:hypothetical protein